MSALATEIWAIAMVRDEADVIEHTIKKMLAQVDRVLIADNLSSDGTREILERLPVWVLEDDDPAYRQSEKMTHLANVAMDEGADWIVPFDADEVHLAYEETLREGLSGLPKDVLVSEAVLIDHVATGQDPQQENPLARMGWRRQQAAPLRKVACRANRDLTIHQGNHSASYAGVEHPKSVTNLAEVRHFPYRSPEQFERKVRNGAAAYAATDLPETAGAHWRSYGRILDEGGPKALEEIFRKWFYREDPEAEFEVEGERQGALIFDPVS